MARLLQNRTPAQLAWIIAASNILVVSSFATLFVHSYRHPGSHRLSALAAALVLALLILGFVLELFAEAALKDGIASQEWPDVLVATARNFFTHPALSAAIVMLFAASIAVIVFSSSRGLAAAWIFLAPALSLTRIIPIFSRPRQTTSGPGTKDPPKPLQSEHWGMPRQSSSS